MNQLPFPDSRRVKAQNVGSRIFHSGLFNLLTLWLHDNLLECFTFPPMQHTASFETKSPTKQLPCAYVKVVLNIRSLIYQTLGICPGLSVNDIHIVHRIHEVCSMLKCHQNTRNFAESRSVLLPEPFAIQELSKKCTTGHPSSSSQKIVVITVRQSFCVLRARPCP